jgi:hypothetical protein
MVVFMFMFMFMCMLMCVLMVVAVVMVVTMVGDRELLVVRHYELVCMLMIVDAVIPSGQLVECK